MWSVGGVQLPWMLLLVTGLLAACGQAAWLLHWGRPIRSDNEERAVATGFVAAGAALWMWQTAANLPVVAATWWWRYGGGHGRAGLADAQRLAG